MLCFAPVVALAKENPAKVHALGICVRFTECSTEQVPVLYDDCGCDDDGCAPNRILESYAFDVIVDPPLAPKKGQTLADLSAALFVRSPDPSLAANTPRFGPAPVITPATGDSLVYALDAGQPNKVLTLDLTTLHAHNIDAKAPIYALAVATQGDFSFATTGPLAGNKPLIQIMQPGAAPLAPVEVTGAAAATSVLSLAVSSDANRSAIVYAQDSGDLFAFARDNANGLAPAATALGKVDSNCSSFVAAPNGSVAYAIDSTGVIKVIKLIDGGSAAAALTVATTARPTSLSLLVNATQSWLLVVSQTDQSLYIVDTTANNLLATIALDHPPAYVMATDAGMVYAMEEEGGAQYLQAIDAAPLTAAKPAIVEGPRSIGGAGLRVVALEKDASARLLAATSPVDSACDELVWAQLADCGGCGSANCVMLATVERYQTGAAVLDADPNAVLADDLTKLRARIDNREGRRVLASTATLQAWLECLQTQPGAKGDQGPKGDPGIGLYVDLPKILDIGWSFEEQRNLGTFVAQYLSILTAADPAGELTQLITTGGIQVPPLTIYFNKPMKGITRRTMTVTIDSPLPTGVGTAAVYFPIDLKMYGEIIEIQPVAPAFLTTPHTGEQCPYAVSFLPSLAFFETIDAQTGAATLTWPTILLTFLTYLCQRAQVDLPRVLIELNGDFVYSPDVNGNYTEFGVLDGENIGGRVGRGPPELRQPPILGGKNPSGNLTQGGLFSGWFFLTSKDSSTGPMDEAVRAAPVFQSFGTVLNLPAMPPSANFSSAAQLKEAGISADLAKKIVAERGRKPIAGATDLRGRLRLSDQDWTALSSKLVIL